MIHKENFNCHYQSLLQKIKKYHKSGFNLTQENSYVLYIYPSFEFPLTHLVWLKEIRVQLRNFKDTINHYFYKMFYNEMFKMNSETVY